MPIDRTSSSAIVPFQDKTAAFIRRVARYTGPSSYTTGGEALDPTDVFGIGTVNAVVGGVLWNGSAARLTFWDAANEKLVIIDPTTGAEVANGSNQSAFAGQIEALGH
jgi:hypothetical protein